MCPPPPTRVRSYTFQVVQGNADTFWKFQRYHLILEYHEHPALDPPFILLSRLNGVLKSFFRKEAQQNGARLGEAWAGLSCPDREGGRGGCPGPGEGQRALAPSAVTLQAGAPQGGLLLPGSAPEAAWPFQRGTCRSPWTRRWSPGRRCRRRTS